MSSGTKTPHSPPQPPSTTSGSRAIKTAIRELALRLYDAGFNVVPVDVSFYRRNPYLLTLLSIVF